ncbi:MAG: hypothetical protein SchgKO_04950 [Schleiferiaceae bacterium]
MTQGENLSSKVVGKVSQLVKQYQELAQVVEQQKAELNQRDREIQTLHGQVEGLKEEIKALQVGDAIKASSGSNEAAQKINALVREIDKCIALLNQ